MSTAGNSATSASSYVVRKPSISSFSPTLVDPGAPIAVSGTNLNLVPGSTSFTVGGLSTSLVSVSHNKATSTAPNGSGLVTVDTSYGQASSTQALTVVPSAIGTANIVASGPLTPGASPLSVSIPQQNRFAVMPIQAALGQLYTLRLSSVAIVPSSNAVTYTVYAPNNTVFTSGSFQGPGKSIDLPQIPASGTYLVTLASGTATSVQMSISLILSPTLSPDGAPINVATTAAGHTQRFSFHANAGENLGLGLRNVSTASFGVALYVKQLNGSTVSSVLCYTTFVPGCQLSRRNLPVTGHYSIELLPTESTTMSFTLTFSQDVSGTLTPDIPLNVNLALPGQNGLLTFAATAVPNLAAGTYSVLLVPAHAATATMQVTSAAQSTLTLPTDGSTTPVTTSVLGQFRYFTFNGTAGQNLGLALTNLSSSSSGSAARSPAATLASSRRASLSSCA